MKFFELFAGAGGLSRGLETAGWECVGHAEIGTHARSVLRYQWPNVPLHGDVSQIDGASLPPFDMLTGGSPCQDLSIAGKREGLAGAKSSLFFQQMRIWEESQAPLILWENVYGALSSNKRADFAAVLSALVGSPVPIQRWARGGVVSGRTAVAAWRVLDAKYFGVPQRRTRVFILGARAGICDPAEVLALSEGVFGHLAASGGTRESPPAPTPRSPGEAGEALTPWDAQSKRVFAVRTAQTSANGHGVAEDVTHTPDGANGQAVLAIDLHQVTSKTNRVRPSTECPPLTPKGQPIAFHATQTPISGSVAPGDGATAQCGIFTKTQYGAYDAAPGVASTLGARDHASQNTDIVVSLVDSRRGLVSEGVSPPLTTDSAHHMGPCVVPTVSASFQARAPRDSADLSVEVTMPTTAGIPRRLMPVECERLMGWPDDSTATGINEKGQQYALKDGPRYTLCGNGVASPCAAWIGFRLRTALDSAWPAPVTGRRAR